VKDKVEKVYAKFCAVNKKYFSKKNDYDKQKSDVVLVEGFMAEAGPNYVVRVGTLAKKIEEITRTKCIVLLQNGAKVEQRKKQIFSSYNIKNYIGIVDDILPHINHIRRRLLTYYFFLLSFVLILAKEYNIFRKLVYKGVQFGDLIYDEYIKSRARTTHTLKLLTPKDIRYFRSTFKLFLACDYLYNKFNIKYYLATHSQYITYGLPFRYFFRAGATTFETTDDLLLIYDKNTFFIPKYHTVIRKKVIDVFNAIEKDDSILEKTKNILQNRFTGNEEQIDAKLAYKNKLLYSKEYLNKKLDIKNNNPIVFIFAHIFSDAPCGLGDSQLFPDYYIWLKETIRVCSMIKNINWIVKEHPSVNAYNEKGECAKIITRYNKNKNIYMCPTDFSTASIIDSAHAVLTAQGTVGIEYSCVGIPIVITSAAFYSGFGFTIEPKTKNEYFHILRHIGEIKKLSEDQKRSALIVYSIFQSMFNKDFSLIDTMIKNMVWGCDVPRNILGAYELLAKRLENTNPNNMYFIKQIEEYFETDGFN
jgi:hypothetical protein